MRFIFENLLTLIVIILFPFIYGTLVLFSWMAIVYIYRAIIFVFPFLNIEALIEAARYTQ